MSDRYLLYNYNKTKIINDYKEEFFENKLKLRKINLNKILWNKRIGLINDIKYQIKCGQKDIDLIKKQDNDLSLNSPIIILKTVLSSIQFYNKYKNNKRTNKNNLNNRKTSVNNKKDNLKNKVNKKQENNNNNDDNGNNNTNINNKQHLHNTNHYIKGNLIVNVKNKEKIFPEDLI